MGASDKAVLLSLFHAMPNLITLYVCLSFRLSELTPSADE
jgi:hypothetical protein